ncbi:MAG: hypothetical protein AAB469_00240 [Patescibacteria group bacterium]
MSVIPAPLPGRPAFIEMNGGRIYISVHDRWHMAEERRFKRRIMAVHPDRVRVRRFWATSRTRNLLRLRQAWRKKEMNWYIPFGLEPPTNASRHPALSKTCLALDAAS